MHSIVMDSLKASLEARLDKAKPEQAMVDLMLLLLPLSVQLLPSPVMYQPEKAWGKAWALSTRAVQETPMSIVAPAMVPLSLLMWPPLLPLL